MSFKAALRVCWMLLSLLFIATAAHPYGSSSPPVMGSFPLLLSAARGLGGGGISLPAHTQTVVIAAGDEWCTSDSGFAHGDVGATRQFVRNLLRYLQKAEEPPPTKPAKPVKPHPAAILIYSTHWTFGAPFQDALRQDHHTVTQTMNPGSLDAYDVVFVGGDAGVDREKLRTYARAGGKVYIAGSTGFPHEREFWNGFLVGFGLQFADTPNIDGLVAFQKKGASLFQGVGRLLIRGPWRVEIVPSAAAPRPALTGFSSDSGIPYWGVFSSKAVQAAK